MGSSCSCPVTKIQASGISGIYDISKINKGVLLFKTSELTDQSINDSILHFQSKLSKNPDDFLSNLHLGVCLYKQGFYNVSEYHLERSIKINETYTAYYILGLVSIHKGNFNESLRLLEAAVMCKRDFMQAYLKSAEIYIRLNNLHKAKELLKVSQKLESSSSEVLMVFGLYYKAKKQLEYAKQFFKKAAKASDDPGRCYFYIAEILQIQGNHEKALDFYKKASIHSSNSIKGIIKIYQSLSFLQLEKFELMLKSLKESLTYGLQVSNILQSTGFTSAVKCQELLAAIQSYTKKRYFEVVSKLKPLFRESRSNLLAGFFLALAFKGLKHARKSSHYFKKIIRYGESQDNPLALTLIEKARREFEINEVLTNERSEASESKDEIKENHEAKRDEESRRVNKKTVEKFDRVEEVNDTMENIDSPRGLKLYVPEFIKSTHSFSIQTEPNDHKLSLLISEDKQHSIQKVHRSVTPTKPSLGKFAGSVNIHSTESCSIY